MRLPTLCRFCPSAIRITRPAAQLPSRSCTNLLPSAKRRTSICSPTRLTARCAWLVGVLFTITYPKAHEFARRLTMQCCFAMFQVPGGPAAAGLHPVRQSDLNHLYVEVLRHPRLPHWMACVQGPTCRSLHAACLSVVLALARRLSTCLALSCHRSPPGAYPRMMPCPHCHSAARCIAAGRGSHRPRVRLNHEQLCRRGARDRGAEARRGDDG